MAKLPEDKRKAFTDAYRFYETNWDMEDTEENWHKCAAELGPVDVANGSSRLIRNLMNALYETINEDIKDAKAV